MGFKGIDRVSIKTLSARVVVPFIMGAYQRERFGFAKGQADLVRRKDSKWFLLVTVDLPEGAPVAATDWIGVDVGVINLATDSDGEHYSGERIEATRQKYADKRSRLQKAASASKKHGKRPKNIGRKLKTLSQKESRFRCQSKVESLKVESRPGPSTFDLKTFDLYADINAALNLRARAAVIRPMVAEPAAISATLVQQQAASV